MGSARGEELAGLYRKIADMQTEITEAETRLGRARAESAGADEMVGQMLARVGEVEARLRQAEEALAHTTTRADDAEERADITAAQLVQSRHEVEGLRADISAARREADAARADAEALGGEAEALRAKLIREQEERESFGLRVADLANVCEERDGALLREELLEAELESLRTESSELRAAHTAELSAALAREEEAGARVIGAGELEALRAERDALASEARHLRAAVASVGRALADLEHNLHPAGEPAPPRKADDDEPAITLTGTGEGEDDEATKVFGRKELELVRETARVRVPPPRGRP